MTSRLELLDLIDLALTQHLGATKIARRKDGVIVVAGSSEAFLIQALLVDAPEETDAASFGDDLVEFIRSRTPHAVTPQADQEGEMTFYTSGNGDSWLLVTDTGGRRFVRHVPNAPSGGDVELTDLQSFRDREPHSPQNQALEHVLAGYPQTPAIHR